MKKPNDDTIEVDALVEDPDNPRGHTDANIEMIHDSIKAVGFGRSILLDEDNVVRAGNGTLRAAKKAGLKKVRVIEVSGDEIVALKRTNLTDQQKKLVPLFDNRAGELATWNVNVLRKLTDEERTRFFNDKDFRALVKANMVNEDADPGNGQAQNEPTIEHEHTIEIGCTKEALAEMRPILEAWAALPGVVVTIV